MEESLKIDCFVKMAHIIYIELNTEALKLGRSNI
jgi:hypothetical protein